MKLRKPKPPEPAIAPHCDSRVLHAPSTCEYCDYYPQWQELRQLWGIAYTNNDPVVDPKRPWLSEVACPSEVRRREVVNRWPGNRSRPVEVAE